MAFQGPGANHVMGRTHKLADKLGIQTRQDLQALQQLVENGTEDADFLSQPAAKLQRLQNKLGEEITERTYSIAGSSDRHLEVAAALKSLKLRKGTSSSGSSSPRRRSGDPVGPPVPATNVDPATLLAGLSLRDGPPSGDIKTGSLPRILRDGSFMVGDEGKVQTVTTTVVDSASVRATQSTLSSPGASSPASPATSSMSITPSQSYGTVTRATAGRPLSPASLLENTAFAGRDPFEEAACREAGAAARDRRQRNIERSSVEEKLEKAGMQTVGEQHDKDDEDNNDDDDAGDSDDDMRSTAFNRALRSRTGKLADFFGVQEDNLGAIRRIVVDKSREGGKKAAGTPGSSAGSSGSDASMTTGQASSAPFTSNQGIPGSGATTPTRGAATYHLRIHFANQTHMTLSVPVQATSVDVCAHVLRKILVSDRAESYGLYVMNDPDRPSGTQTCLGANENVFEAMRKWRNSEYIMFRRLSKGDRQEEGEDEDLEEDDKVEEGEAPGSNNSIEESDKVDAKGLIDSLASGCDPVERPLSRASSEVSSKKGMKTGGNRRVAKLATFFGVSVNQTSIKNDQAELVDLLNLLRDSMAEEQATVAGAEDGTLEFPAEGGTDALLNPMWNRPTIRENTICKEGWLTTDGPNFVGETAAWVSLEKGHLHVRYCESREAAISHSDPVQSVQLHRLEAAPVNSDLTSGRSHSSNSGNASSTRPSGMLSVATGASLLHVVGNVAHSGPFSLASAPPARYSFLVRNVDTRRVIHTFQATSVQDRDDWVLLFNKLAAATAPPTPIGGISAFGGVRSPSTATSLRSFTDSASASEGRTRSRTKSMRASIDDFEFHRVLGKGKYGKVLLCSHRVSKKAFAIKVIQKNEESAGTAQNESEILRSIRHPFIVGLHFAFENPERLYVVMEYVNGGELFFHLGQSGRFTEKRARFYVAEVLLALQCLHGKGVVYRDLKLENVLLDRNGHIKIADFGLSRISAKGETQRAFSLAGTVEYFAPEVIHGIAYSFPADWWAFGVILFELLCGYHPFYSPNPETLYQLILSAPLEFPPFVSSKAADLISRLLDRDHTRRLGSGAQGSREIQQHPFFKEIDWLKLFRKDVEPPWKPELQDEFDVKFFDTEFTSETIQDSEVRGAALPPPPQPPPMAATHGASQAVTPPAEVLSTRPSRASKKSMIGSSPGGPEPPPPIVTAFLPSPVSSTGSPPHLPSPVNLPTLFDPTGLPEAPLISPLTISPLDEFASDLRLP